MTHTVRSDGQYPVEGTLKIDLKLFPQEIISQFMSGQMIPLNVMLPSIFLQDGVTIDTDIEGAVVEFSFAAFDINVDER